MRIPRKPPEVSKILGSWEPDKLLQFVQKKQSPEFAEFLRRANHDYLHWDKLRHHRPLPEGATHDEMWVALAMARSSQMQPLPLTLGDDQTLQYWTPPRHLEWLHRIDQDAGGLIGSRSEIAPHDSGDRFLFNSLMEEAIASSQLEGATTTREVAKKMLRTKRKPRDRNEQMILNNYEAILEIRDLKNEQLTPEMLCRIQEILTRRTLDVADASGRFRNANDSPVHVVDALSGDTLHEPPSFHAMEWRIEELCDFANSKPSTFIHPVIKAIALHFMIGYIHPFVDGNGRTARAVFYWFMLRNGYWIFEYLPISRIVLDASVKYGRAYLYTESDEADLTYFNHFNLLVIDRAVKEMHEYFSRQQTMMREAYSSVRAIPGLNHREVAVAYAAIQNPTQIFTVAQHAGEFDVTKATARTDLFHLESMRVLEKHKDGKKWMFIPAAKVARRLNNAAFRATMRAPSGGADPPVSQRDLDVQKDD